MKSYYSDISTAFFDLFFTLVTPSYSLIRNENDVFGLTIEDWEAISESPALYCERATGNIKDPYKIMERIMENSGLHATPAQISEALQLRKARMRSALTNIDPVVLKTLSALKEKGVPLCLISNADVIDKEWWENSPLFPFFDDAVFSCDAGFVKPMREIYETAVKRMGVNPQNCCFVGDGGSGELKAAKEFGMFTILTEHFLKRDHEDLKVLLAHTDFHAKTISDVLSLFD